MIKSEIKMPEDFRGDTVTEDNKILDEVEWRTRTLVETLGGRRGGCWLTRFQREPPQSHLRPR